MPASAETRKVMALMKMGTPNIQKDNVSCGICNKPIPLKDCKQEESKPTAGKHVYVLAFRCPNCNSAVLSAGLRSEEVA